MFNLAEAILSACFIMNPDQPLKIFHPIQVKGLQRLGHKYDGGYIVHFPSLKDADYLLNYGVGYNVDFEKDFFKKTGIPTLAFDPTLKDISVVVGKLLKGQIIPFLRHLKNYTCWPSKERKLKDYKINFIEEGIAATDTELYKSVAYHLKKHGLTDKKIILKIDVEGAEYPVFNDPAIYDLLPNCIQIIMEIHELEKNMPDLITIMNKISKTHSLIHIHANNHAGTFEYDGKNVPDAIEVTFLLNDYIPEKKYATQAYPLPGLDQPCDRKKEDIALDFFL
ncbi:hypothetical protein EON78_06155 [bacterium]|nr:MAG: hypothetical protein EON78_06155 [bacterium]